MYSIEVPTLGPLQKINAGNKWRNSRSLYWHLRKILTGLPWFAAHTCPCSHSMWHIDGRRGNSKAQDYGMWEHLSYSEGYPGWCTCLSRGCSPANHLTSIISFFDQQGIQMSHGYYKFICLQFSFPLRLSQLLWPWASIIPQCHLLQAIYLLSWCPPISKTSLHSLKNSC